MDLGIDGRRALVVGASEGIGRAAAEGLLREGARVAIAARDGGKLATAAAAMAAATGRSAPQTWPCDVTKAADVEALAKGIGGAALDILVIAVGASRRADFETLTDADWYANYELNLLGSVRVTRDLLSALRRSSAPTVVLVGAAGAKQPYAHQVVSNVHKAGLLALTKTLAAEYASAGIRVNSVCPGRTMTALWRNRLADMSRADGRSEDEIRAEFVSEIPLGRFGEANEIADMIVFLSSRRASYVTGQSISVDGGITRGLL